MGQTSSSETPTTLPEFALHCLRVADNSPADGLLEPFFDYLIGVDAASSVPTGAAAAVAVPTPSELARVLEENEGVPIRLTVYNAKTQRVRGEWTGVAIEDGLGRRRFGGVGVGTAGGTAGGTRRGGTHGTHGAGSHYLLGCVTPCRRV